MVHTQPIGRLPKPLHALALDFASSCTVTPQAVMASVCARFVIQDGCAVFKFRQGGACLLYYIKAN